MIGERHAYCVHSDDPQPIWAGWGAGRPDQYYIRSAVSRLNELYELLGVDPNSPNAQDEAVGLLGGNSCEHCGTNGFCECGAFGGDK